jgi:hypothetical protein
MLTTHLNLTRKLRMSGDVTLPVRAYVAWTGETAHFRAAVEKSRSVTYSQLRTSYSAYTT